MLSAAERTRLVENISGHLKDAQEFIQKRAVGNFAQADPEFGRQLREALAAYKPKAQVGQRRAVLCDIVQHPVHSRMNVSNVLLFAANFDKMSNKSRLWWTNS